MARTTRIQFSGAYYHIVARGYEDAPIFIDNEDRKHFIKLLGEACGRTGWQVFAWVLMDNHYHLFLQTPEPNLVAGMHWLQNAFTHRFQARHPERQRVFGDRYKSIFVEGDEKSGKYFQALLDYIHLNPVRGKQVKPQKNQSVVKYAWSSIQAYTVGAKERPAWLNAAAALKACGLGDTPGDRKKFIARLDKRAAAEPVKDCGVVMVEEGVDARRSHLRRGWFWGTAAFAKKLTALAKKPKTETVAENQAQGEPQAAKLLKEGLAAAGVTKAQLGKLKGSDPLKSALALLIWQNTTVSLEWLTANVGISSAGNASQQLRQSAARDFTGIIPAKLLKLLGRPAKGK